MLRNNAANVLRDTIVLLCLNIYFFPLALTFPREMQQEIYTTIASRLSFGLIDLSSEEILNKLGRFELTKRALKHLCLYNRNARRMNLITSF